MWLSRQSDSLVMNRSAVRIRPPAPQNPLGKRAGFLFSVGGFLPFADASMRPARLRVQINRRISAIPSRKRSLRIRPPAPQNPLGKRAGFLFSVGGFLPFADASMRPARLRVQINRRISAIPSRKRSLRIRPPAPHSRKASYATPRKFCGVFAYVPAPVSTRRKNTDVRPAPRFVTLFRNYRVAL